MNSASFIRQIEDEAGRRRIPRRSLPMLDKGRVYTDGFWLDVSSPPATVRFEMFQMERQVRTPVFETYDPAEALRLVLWHADTAARKASVLR